MPINTTGGAIPRPGEGVGHIVNTSRVVEEDMVYEDEGPEIISVLPGQGWHATIKDEDGLRTIPLACFVAEDTGRMYGASVGEDGRIDLVEGDVEKRPGFAGYGQANNNDKEK